MDDHDITFDSPDAIRDMNQRHADLGRKMQAVALYALAELEARAAAGEPLMTEPEARRMLDAGEKMERRATGKPTRH